MEFIINNILVIMFLPLWVSFIILINSVVSIAESKKLTTVLTLISTFVGIIFAVGIMFAASNSPNPLLEENYLWFSTGGLNFYLGILADKISALFLIILMSVSFVVQLYSYSYMYDEEKYNRYFIYLNLFNFSMAGLILSSNLVQMYIFWELVGVCSYLLIGFWIKKYSASKAAQKAFLINRIGDCGLLLGIIFLIYFSYSYLNITGPDFLAFTNMQNFAEQISGLTMNSVFNLICVFILMGALAKSAQFPLHVWLADAMEAPTPVSALIHAATMVAAGIFLIIRMYPMFMFSSVIMNLILIIGLFTAFITAYFALTQSDIKKMLAHSTSSQLGIMFAVLGALAPSAALFHLTTHAFFKAMLFLCAGIIIKYFADIHDMKKMGGLRNEIPICAICYFIGALALSGLCFSGFSSKEAVLTALYNSQPLWISIVFLLISFMTSFYIFKSYFIIFEGGKKSEVDTVKIHPVMNLSIIILLIPAIFSGFYLLKNNFETFINPLGLSVASGHNVKLIFISLFISLLGAAAAFVIVKKDRQNSFLPIILHKLSYNKFYLDNIYEFITKKIFGSIFKLLEIIDKYVVDGLVKLIVLIFRFFAWVVSKMQNGNFQTYIAYSILVTGIIMFCVVEFYFRLLKG